MLKQLLFWVLMCLATSSIKAQLAPHLVIDLGEGDSFSESNFPLRYSFDDYVIFRSYDGDFRSLWLTDGRKSGTFKLVDFNEGERINRFVELGQYIYVSTFGSDIDENNIYQIDKNSFEVSSILKEEESVRYLTHFENSLFYFSEDDLKKLDLNTLISEVVYSFDSFYGADRMIVLNDQLFIIAGRSNGTFLFTSDGTTEGTDYHTYLGDITVPVDFNLIKVNEQLACFYYGQSDDYLLYSTDGTEEGTQPLKTFKEILSTDYYTAFDDKLVFNTDLPFLPSGDNRCFVSDGTPEGTIQLFQDDNNRLWSVIL